jgi:integrative and conjugative element protein (TIGR02256 family)
MTSANHIWIAENCLATMHQLAGEKYPLETGGMLIGYVASTGEPVVTSIIGPGPNAKHRRFKFTPDGLYQQSMLEARFKATDGGETYLGDWHTHPQGTSTLSYLDKCTLARIAKEPRSQISQPIMIVLGDGKDEWQLDAVRFHSTEKKLLFKIHHTISLVPVLYSNSQETKECI